MSDEKKVALRTAIPTVVQTKVLGAVVQTPTLGGNHLIEVRAETRNPRISIHYEVGPGAVPRVGEDVLVAILQGAPSGWMTQSNLEPIQVQFPSRSQGREHRAAGIAVFQTADHDRIRFRLQYHDATSDSVDLDADQATVLVTALLGILRRME